MNNQTVRNNGDGIVTRSRSARENASLPLLRQPKLTQTRGYERTPAEQEPLDQEAMAVDGFICEPLHGNEIINSAGSNPSSQVLGYSFSQSIKHDSTINSQQAVSNTIQAPPPAEYYAVKSSLAVCCATCQVIYQRVSGADSKCPLCKLHGTTASNFSRWESDLVQLQQALIQCGEQVRALEQDLRNVGGLISELKAALPTPVDDSLIATQVLDRVTATVQIDNLEKKFAEIETFNVSDLISQFDARKRRLDEEQEKLDDLLSSFNESIKQLRNLVAGAESHRVEMTAKICAEETGVRQPGSQGASVPPFDSEPHQVLIVGDFNVNRLTPIAKNLFGGDKRLTMHGNSDDRFADSVTFCSKWLQEAKQPEMIIVHSGLRNVIDFKNPNVVDPSELARSICASIRDLKSYCMDAGVALAICSIPEVIEFRKRIDWRFAIFQINSAIKSLAAELEFQYIDLASEICENYTMARDGIHYNRTGSLRVMNLLSAFLSPCLGEPANLSSQHRSVTQLKNGTPRRLGGNGRRRYASPVKPRSSFSAENGKRVASSRENSEGDSRYSATRNQFYRRARSGGNIPRFAENGYRSNCNNDWYNDHANELRQANHHVHIQSERRNELQNFSVRYTHPQLRTRNGCGQEPEYDSSHVSRSQRERSNNTGFLNPWMPGCAPWTRLKTVVNPHQ